MEMRVEKVTPELAAGYLKRNVDNYRRIVRATAKRYADEMKAGKWELNGEPIVFDKGGKLKDGQHRLAAIIIAGVPVEMTIIEGVDEETTIYNIGMSRSTKQIAAASGCGDITGTEAATGTAIVGEFDSKAPKGKIVDFIKANYAGINRAYRICQASSKGISRRVGCVLAAYMMLEVEEMKSYELEVFFKVFRSGNVIGADGYEVSSALVARRMFEERYKGTANNKRTLMEQVEILVMAMRDFQKGKTRQMNYQVKEPMACADMMKKLREMKGL